MDHVELPLQRLQRLARKSGVFPHSVVADFCPFNLEPSKLLACPCWMLVALSTDLADADVVATSPPSLLCTVCLGSIHLASQAGGTGQASLLRPEAWARPASAAQRLQLLRGGPPSKLSARVVDGGLPLDFSETPHKLFVRSRVPAPTNRQPDQQQ
jgi:hypothetical protein